MRKQAIVSMRGCLILLWVPCALFAGPNAARFDLEWGLFGNGQGTFHLPDGIAIGPSGRVYVVDTINSLVQVFTSDGEFLISWGSPSIALGGFNNPRGIAVDSEERAIVSQRNGWEVNVYTWDGSFIVESEAIIGATDVTVDDQNNIYVAETEHGQIRKLAADATSLGRLGQGLLAQDGPNGLVVDPQGAVFASDTGNHRVVKFSPSGELLMSWGSEGSTAGKFRYPRGLGIDAQGNVYVVDTENHRVQVFSSTAQFLLEWGEYGTELGQFRFPRDVVIDPQGRVYVTDTFNHRVQRFVIDPSALQIDVVAAIPITWGKLKISYLGN